MSETTESKRTAKPLGKVGRYALRAELASGGMAAVYLAELHGPHGFEKTVAVKRIHPHLANDRRFVEMFLDEARLAARIHHPNVCAIVDFGEEEGSPYLAMEYLRGEPLSAVMKRIRTLEATPFWLPVRIVHDAALGLHAAHRVRGADGELLGVVHRDVSPQNVFVLYDGVTKVVDFGVARARGRLTTTRTNEIKGKLGYMAPEQFNQEAVDARTDVWALGVVLWEATVGRRLFRGENDGATLNLVLHKPIPRPSERCADYPAELERIVMRCLERDPERRHPSAEALAGELEEYLYATGKPAGPSQVRKWMETHFADRITAQEALLRGEALAARADDDLEASHSELRTREEPDPDDRPTRVATPPRRAEPVRPRAGARSGWKPLLWMAGGAAIVLGVGTLVRPNGAPAAPAMEPPAPPLPTASAPIEPAPATAPVVAEPVVAPAPDEPTARAPELAPAAEPRSTVASTETARRAHGSRAARAERATPAPVRAEARPPTSAVAPAAPGRLSLIAIPSASVRLGGRTIGQTPIVNLALPAGTHRLDLRGENGVSRSVTVRIESGETTRMRVEL